MDFRKTETLYLQRRVSDSLAMAAAAAGPCAQIAHMTLARLYGEAIDTLVAQPRRPTLHALFSTAAAAERANPDGHAGSPQAKPMILKLAESERQLASTLLARGLAALRAGPAERSS